MNNTLLNSNCNHLSKDHKSMKKILSILCILTITMIACQKTLVDEAEQKSSAILTRSADANATYYYWYKGEKIALTTE